MVAGAVRGVPQRRDVTSRMDVRVQLDLLADDGTLLPKEFEACIFTGSSYKGTYKLERDADRLRVRPSPSAPYTHACIIRSGSRLLPSRRSG